MSHEQQLSGRHLLDRAREVAGQGDYAAASVAYSRVIGNRDPTIHVEALLGLADARYRLDDEEGALQAWLAAAQGPETPMSWRAWVALAGARVREGDLRAAIEAYREAERRAPYDERAQIASRLGWLHKELGSAASAQRYFGRARTGVFQPVVTYAILATTVAISVLTLFGGGEALVPYLMLDKAALAEGEYWRLLTVTLVHGSLIHLLFNMYALYICGPIVEALYGRALFLLFYLLSAAAGSVASYLFIASPSVGASGAIFGLFGVLLTSTYVHKPALGRQARGLTGQIAMLIVLNLALGFGLGGFARIDNAAHVGGLLAGAWLGFVIVPRGVATLASLWQRSPAPAMVDGDGPAEGDPVGAGGATVLRLAAVLGLIGVILVGLSLSPFWA
ncbi:MAG TPA: rhomboid family intramembrane serine protease [Candidatus Limnocylindria bacterium]|nr:rhomboid family intramembrane serine protease [Candidatus Limnocylindria bacterium]